MALIMHIILVPSIFASAYAILKEQKFHDLRYIRTHILYTAIFSYDWGMSWLPSLKGYDIMRIWNVETMPLPPNHWYHKVTWVWPILKPALFTVDKESTVKATKNSEFMFGCEYHSRVVYAVWVWGNVDVQVHVWPNLIIFCGWKITVYPIYYVVACGVCWMCSYV